MNSVSNEISDEAMEVVPVSALREVEPLSSECRLALPSALSLGVRDPTPIALARERICSSRVRGGRAEVEGAARTKLERGTRVA